MVNKNRNGIELQKILKDTRFVFIIYCVPY